MTDPVPQASPEWISTTRLCAEHEHPPRVDVRIINGAAEVGPTGRPRQLDPIHILGCIREEAVAQFHGRPKSYWITTAEAARILKLTPRQAKAGERREP